MIEIPRDIYSTINSFEEDVQEIRRETDEYKKGLKDCIDKHQEIKDKVDSIYNKQIFIEDPYTDLEKIIKYNKHSYEDMINFIGYEVKLDGFLSLHPVVICNKSDGSKYSKRIPLSKIAESINSLVKNTALFTPQEIMIARGLSDRVERLWDEAEEKIKKKSLIVQLFHEMLKVFGWRIAVELPEEIRNIEYKREGVLYLL